YANRKREAPASRRSLHSIFAGMRRSVPVAPTRPTAVVVRAEAAPVGRVVPNGLLELRSVLDLSLRAVHEDLFVRGVGPLDRPCRKHHLLAEDPRTRVDDDARRAGVIGCI